MERSPPEKCSTTLCHLSGDTKSGCTTLCRLFVVDVPRLRMESGQIAPTSPSAPSHLAWSSAPCGLLQCLRESSNLLPLMGSGPARPDRPRQNNNNNNYHFVWSIINSSNPSINIMNGSCMFVMLIKVKNKGD